MNTLIVIAISILVQVYLPEKAKDVVCSEVPLEVKDGRSVDGVGPSRSPSGDPASPVGDPTMAK